MYGRAFDVWYRDVSAGISWSSLKVRIVCQRSRSFGLVMWFLGTIFHLFWFEWNDVEPWLMVWPNDAIWHYNHHMTSVEHEDYKMHDLGVVLTLCCFHFVCFVLQLLDFLVFYFRADRSMYHALGYGTIMYLQATMTFEMVNVFYFTSKCSPRSN